MGVVRVEVDWADRLLGLLNLWKRRCERRRKVDEVVDGRGCKWKGKDNGRGGDVEEGKMEVEEGGMRGNKVLKSGRMVFLKEDKQGDWWNDERKDGN